MITVECCVCHKRKYNDSWTSDYSSEEGEQISHTYCPPCADVARKQILQSIDNSTISRDAHYAKLEREALEQDAKRTGEDRQ